MKSFQFRGEIPASKSLMNRALIAQSYFPALQLQGDSRCDDVEFMRRALAQWQQADKKYSSTECGEGGTTFRFLSARVSRAEGEHILHTHPRLIQRPYEELTDVFAQLGVDFSRLNDGFIIRTEGWMSNPDLKIDCSRSSQFASAIALNAWDLSFDLRFELVGQKVSESYFEMTLKFLRDLGMTIHRQGDRVEIPAQQKIKQTHYRVESDLSSAFSVAAAGALFGEAELLNFPFESTQPDLAFVEILRRMGAKTERRGDDLKISQQDLMAVDVNLSQTPDLFPVLAVVCSFAMGTSQLFGASQLVFKESNRIAQVSSLPDGMIIHGGLNRNTGAFDFNPDHDHRMVMAASLYKLMGTPIQILTPAVINKSFPEFFSVIGISP